MKNKALLIGNSDGIGLALTKALLLLGWEITGISRSTSSIGDSSYRHIVADVSNNEFDKALNEIKDVPDLCIYFAGVGELLDLRNFENEINIFEVNLLGLVKTVSHLIPKMVKKGSGHLIGISSFADEMLSPVAPSYHATKAGFSNYLEGLALAARSNNVFITNVRFGFVDTKMAKGDLKPFMMSTDQAVKHLFRCIEKKPVRYSVPKIIIPLIKLRKWMLRLKTFIR